MRSLPVGARPRCADPTTGPATVRTEPGISVRGCGAADSRVTGGGVQVAGAPPDLQNRCGPVSGPGGFDSRPPPLIVLALRVPALHASACPRSRFARPALRVPGFRAQSHPDPLPPLDPLLPLDPLRPAARPATAACLARHRQQDAHRSREVGGCYGKSTVMRRSARPPGAADCGVLPDLLHAGQFRPTIWRKSSGTRGQACRRAKPSGSRQACR